MSCPGRPALGTGPPEPKPERPQCQRRSFDEDPLPHDQLGGGLRLDRQAAAAGLAGGKPGIDDPMVTVADKIWKNKRVPEGHA